MTAPDIGCRAFKLKPEYLDTPSGRIFVLYFVPRLASGPVKAVIVLPPFAEEMNKSRHMLALLGQRLASAGFLSALPDLYGTGDSEGNFEESTWEQWTSDVRIVARALADLGVESLDVVSLRSGVFLIPGFDGSELPKPKKIVMWNPVQSGAKLIDQILRSKVIKDGANTGSASVAAVRNEIRHDGDIEVAGYRMTIDLVTSIDGLELATLQLPLNSTVHWLNVSPVATDRIPPNIDTMKRAWQERIKDVSYSRVVGPNFWMGPEIDLVPELLTRTIEILASD